MYYSIIIPVFNRPEEIEELMETLCRQTCKGFEVVVVEDGSTVACKHIIEKYVGKLRVDYYMKPNSGPGLSRNYGAARSKGDYLIFLDSDCLLPETYLQEIDNELYAKLVDLFGGADKAEHSFTNIQKAINYSMTSFFTTGGIRGGKKKLDKFFPRSFNMGVRREAFEDVGGFGEMRFGEDIDFSMRMMKKGYGCRYFPEAWVYHKRRTDLKKFFKQVYNSGIARVGLYRKYPESLKWVHWLPALFTIGLVVLLIGSLVCWEWLLPLFAFMLVVLVDASVRTKSLSIGVLSVASSLVQLTAYGSGFLIGLWRLLVLKENKYTAFDENFYD